ncbi:MAG: hypothetical protein H7Z74_00140 [Anaerolineae bacterium]|nr:hypothetical protein [Gemmatimonadaceae bacterium]
MRIRGAHPAQRSTPATYLLVVTGLGGEAQYKRAFHDWSASLVTSAARMGIPDSSITWLAEDTTRARARVNGLSTKANIQRALSRIAERSAAGDHLLVVLIGHGSAQGEASRFSIPGPDISAEEIGRLFAPFTQRKITLVNAASASGDFIRALSGRDRVIITATKTAFERNETMFPRYFVAALDSASADTDKDDRVSILEAYEFARREVERAYQKENRLLSEHSQLDDNGDGVGTAIPVSGSGDGALARTLVLGGGFGTGRAPSSDAALSPLIAEKTRIEQRLATLRAGKSGMDSTAYSQVLEKLLVELARNGQAIRAAGSKPR